MADYIKLPELKKMPDSSIKKRQLSDNIWINNILHIILKYGKIDKTEIISLIQKELKKGNSQIEELIKNDIYKWYKEEKKSNKQIGILGFILNLEPKSDSLTGFYDFKFQHSEWDKYFVFEAKNLGEIKSRKQSTLINEYVYVKTKDREDGGMYRYMTSKYACELNFGGMLGFVVGKNQDLINKLTDKIQSVYDNLNIGKLTGEKIVFSSIENNKNTFETTHIRENNLTGAKDIFSLHHIIFDFINDRK